MRIVPFGTSSGRPTARRNVSGLGLDLGRRWVLVDCGDGTQQQIMRSPLKIHRIDAVLLTHLHGDHVLGLPSLLGTMGMEGRTAPLTLVAPVGVRSWLDAMLNLPILNLTFDVEVLELESAASLGTISGLEVTALPLRHRVPSFGYRFAEPERRGHVDAAAATALGLSGPDIGRLQRGERLDGFEGLDAAQIIGEARPGRVVTILGDTMYAKTSVELALDADLLVHECTYAASDHPYCGQWMHSCSLDVARVATEANVGHVVINHFSSRYPDESVLAAEVRERVPDTTRVTAAVENDPIEIPFSDNQWS